MNINLGYPHSELCKGVSVFCKHPSKENQHMFLFQNSSCNFCTLIAFHMILCDYTSHDKKEVYNLSFSSLKKNVSFPQPNNHTSLNPLSHKIDFTCDTHVGEPLFCITTNILCMPSLSTDCLPS